MRKLVQPTDPILKAVCERVTPEDDLSFLDDMIRVCHEGVGAGIAASQIGVAKQAIYIFPDFKAGFFMLNPVIVHSGGSETKKEGCLSFPGVHVQIERAIVITVNYVTVNPDQSWGHTTEGTFEGLTARIIQHEIDHTNGICRVGDVWFKRKAEANMIRQRMFANGRF